MEASRSGEGSSHPQTVRKPYSQSKKQCCAFETKMEEGWGGNPDVKTKVARCLVAWRRGRDTACVYQENIDKLCCDALLMRMLREGNLP